MELSSVLSVSSVATVSWQDRIMTVAEFKATLGATQPPAGLGQPLLALWYDGRGDWSLAHETAQEIYDATGAWIHAYLHRKEGDLDNAGYWYRRARQPASDQSLSQEWDAIASALLSNVPH